MCSYTINSIDSILKSKKQDQKDICPNEDGYDRIVFHLKENIVGHVKPTITKDSEMTLYSCSQFLSASQHTLLQSIATSVVISIAEHILKLSEDNNQVLNMTYLRLLVYNYKYLKEDGSRLVDSAKY